MSAASSRALSLAIVVTLACLPGCARDSASAEADVTTALTAFYDAMKSGDTTAAMARVHDDAVFVEGGRLETRAEYEKNHLPADIAFEKQVTGQRSPFRVTLEGDTAWVIATTDYAGTYDGAPVNFVSAQLAVLTRQTDDWRIRSIHWSSRRR